MRVLISRLSSLGDVVCTLPAAVAIRRSAPAAEIVWAVDPRFAAIVERCASVDRVLPVKPSFSPGSWPSFEAPFDVALDLQGLLKSALVVARAKAPLKLGFHWQREGAWLFSARVVPDPTSLHVVDQYVDVARAAGAEADRAEFDLRPTDDDRRKAAEALAQAGVEGPYAVLNAGAGWAAKRWPPERFAEVAKGLARAGLRPVLTGGTDRAAREAADAVLARAEAADLVGKTPLGSLVALLASAATHVGGDTGTTHIAAALGVRCVGLYSATRPERCCPYGQASNCLYDPAGLAAIPASAALERALA